VRRSRCCQVSRATLAAVAYDEELAERVRDQLAGVPDVTEKRMFGGLAFLVGGAMAVSARNGGGLLVRADPARGADQLPGARPAVMGTRQMHGWLAVDADAATPDGELARWVRYGLARAHQATGSSSTP
jgi:TfoX/Sxy family transcriptional regulator of competence genes